YPDWWKLEPMADAESWATTVNAINENDPFVRGIVVLGLDAPEWELSNSFDIAARFSLVKGFAVGRTIFGDAARSWLKGEMSDGVAVKHMAARFKRLSEIWDNARAEARVNELQGI
ncbi:2-deoxy-5-keto-D-gluconate 6-phosphate aldolase domain-containing protein, partial [Labrenzia sp. C1B10]